jgi:TolB protein
MHRVKKFFLSVSFLFLTFYYLNAQVTVVKQALAVNPKLFFEDLAGGANFSGYIKSNLINCGWFEVVPSSNDAKYSVSGNIDKNKVYLNITGETSFKLSMSINKSNPRQTAQFMVDAILKKLFNVPGICASKIAFVAQAGKIKEIYECEYDGIDIKKLTNNKSLSLEPNWSKDNKILVYTYYHDNYTNVVGLKFTNGKTYTLASFPGLNMGGTISPNGKYLAIVLSKDKQVELYVKKVYGKGVKRLTFEDAVEASPCWSPNGAKICFVSDKYLRIPKLYIVDVNSGKIFQIHTVGSEAVTPDWSSVGDKIVYSARFGKQFVLAVYDIKSKKSSTVKNIATGNWMSPSWAPDGRHVVCSRILDYHSQLYVVDTWTGMAKKLLKTKMNISSPDWSELDFLGLKR